MRRVRITLDLKKKTRIKQKYNWKALMRMARYG